ncbi:response regulator [Blastopirellula retiformator]|nr:response regulator [Blastopirellula retiformator]
MKLENVSMGFRTLIADDDADIVELLAFHCRQKGLGVHFACNAMTTLQKAERVMPDVIILDVNMPQGNGLSVCEMLANHHRLSGVPVIILTGCSSEETIRRCHSLCAYYVPKCANIWARIEPLLDELLTTGEETHAVAS